MLLCNNSLSLCGLWTIDDHTEVIALGNKIGKHRSKSSAYLNHQVLEGVVHKHQLWLIRLATTNIHHLTTHLMRRVQNLTQNNWSRCSWRLWQWFWYSHLKSSGMQYLSNFLHRKKSSWTFCVSPVHYSYCHGVGHTAVWGGTITFDQWYYALLSRVKQMSQLCFFCGSNHQIRPTNHIRIRLKWAPFKQKFWLKCAPSNFWDLNQINLIYVFLSQIQFCREHSLFEGHFWPKFGDGGH